MNNFKDVMEGFDNLMIKEYGKWKIGRMEAKAFFLSALQSETAKAREEMKSEIKDIIIDWEKKLGSLKTKAGGYVNLTYLLGKIK